MNRREFLQSTIAAAAFTRPAVPASDRVRIAVVGVRGQGRNLTNQFCSLPDVDVPYLVDPDSNVFSRAAKIVEEKRGKAPQLVGDLRKVLDDKSVDAIAIATPDHWHGPATLLAIDAGKDVFVEKPCSHNVREGQMMVEAARRGNRVVQAGTLYRSYPTHLRAVEYVRAGKLGKALMAKAWDVQLRDDIGHQEDGPVPAGVDYDTWTGPAPMLPFNVNRFHYKWHWHWNYGTGDIGNDGVHQVDIARWVLGLEAPTEVSGMARKVFFQDDQITPDTANITFNYPDKAIIFEMRIWNPYGMEGQENAVAIYGSDGVMHIGRWRAEGGWKNGYRVYDKQNKLALEDYETDVQPWHARNFIDCVKSRQKPNADIEIGVASTLLTHLANIVARTGRNIKWDAKNATIPGDAQAARLLGREYRKHWATPKGV
jgi:predicted dehydrogenase